MKRKFKLLSILSAVVLSATTVLSACANGSVAEHDHEWNDGEITKAATCYSEGVKTYTCTFDGCGQTKTEPVAMTAHSWDNGEVTKEPKCNEEGEKTFKCTAEGCNKTKTEPVDKTDHRWNDGEITRTPDFLTKGAKKYTCLDCDGEKSESVAAHADFAEQYYTSASAQSNWTYGYASHYNWEAGEIEFATIEQADTESNSWKAAGVEISKGHVYSANNAIISYSFSDNLPAGTQANVNITFTGDESTTVLTALLILTNAEGEPLEDFELNADEAKDWSFGTEEAVDVDQGYTIWLVFENAGEGAAGGELTFTITAPCVHVWSEKITPASCTQEGKIERVCLVCDEKYSETIGKTPHEYDYENGKINKPATETENGEIEYKCKNCDDTITEVIPRLASFTGANFGTDFELNPDGEFNGWSVGVVNYNFGPDTFDFTKITALNGNGDCYHSDSPWMDIKGDWMAVNGMMGFAYHFYSSAGVTVNFNLTSDAANKFGVRWAVKDKSGNIKINEGRAEYVGAGNNVTATKNIYVENGDVLYILVNKEDDSAGDQCNFSLVLTPAFADFRKDFELNTNGEFNSWSVGVVNYNFGPETFDFTKITAFNGNGDCYHSDSPWMDIKGDWMAVNGMMGFAYKFQDAASFNFDFYLNSAEGGNFTIRWAIKDSAGNIKINDGKADWGGVGKDVTVNKDITVEANDVLYILVNKEENSATDQCNFNLVLFQKEQAPEQPQPPQTQEVEIANFKKDFYRDLNDKNNWLYGYSNYNFDGGESFEFHQFTGDNYVEGEGAWKTNEDGSAQIKDDWIDVGWANGIKATIGYHTEEATTFNLRLHFNGGMPNTRVMVRIGIKDKDGRLKETPKAFWNGKENREWSLDEEFTLEAGDTIYIIFFDEHGDLEEGWANGNVDISLVQIIQED